MIRGTAGSTAALGTGILTFGDGTNQTFFGSVTGAGGGLTLQGAGMFTLGTSSVATYTGTTLVNVGTFQAGVSNAFSASSLVNLAASGGGTCGKWITAGASRAGEFFCTVWL